MLEYYEGILFLTTNRVETMDVAFQSRIHIAIQYNPLSPAVRRQIWENFIKRIDKREAKGKQELVDHLDDMQEWELNGRQIRNILGIAESIALSQDLRRGALRYRHVEEVTNETINFDNFFEETHKDRKSQVGVINNRQFQEKRLRSFR
jgi:AAA+ superfamily predicted ATPase